ncbi:MAG TPA: PEP-utilizing enzyme, partial [Xanthobacteraceae bacterium]
APLRSSGQRNWPAEGTPVPLISLATHGRIDPNQRSMRRKVAGQRLQALLSATFCSATEAHIVTAVGGRTAHAALVARQMGKPCIVDCTALDIDVADRSAQLAGARLSCVRRHGRTKNAPRPIRPKSSPPG